VGLAIVHTAREAIKKNATTIARVNWTIGYRAAFDSVTVAEIMALYGCPEERAKKVIAMLEKDSLLVLVGPGAYKVTIGSRFT
jgi:hypothetical protein